MPSARVQEHCFQPSTSCNGSGEEADVDWPGSGYLFRGRDFDVVTRQFPPAPFGTVGAAANSLLGLIGIARIRTIGVGIHRAVPLPTHYLVVFCACFRLISEHGGHRWSILIGQNRAQHPDLGFHVGVLICRLHARSLAGVVGIQVFMLAENALLT